LKRKREEFRDERENKMKARIKPVVMDPDNSAPQIIFVDSHCIVNTKGYRMARASCGVCGGSWYWEAKIETAPNIATQDQVHHVSQSLPAPHWRLGWATGDAHLQAPVGYDKYSYGYRDIEGRKIHMAYKSPYGIGYSVGDVIGFLIILSDVNIESRYPDPRLQFDPPTSSKKDEELEVHLNSKIIFFKNGVSQGVAFEDIYKGCYFPAISLYYNAAVTVNFGPKFNKLPDTSYSYLPFSDAPNHIVK